MAQVPPNAPVSRYGGSPGAWKSPHNVAVCSIIYACSCGTSHHIQPNGTTNSLVFTCSTCGSSCHFMADYGSGHTCSWSYQTPKAGHSVTFSDEEMAASDSNMGNTWEVEYQSANGFKKSLMECIERAVDHDLVKLKAIYPNTVALYENTAGDFKHGVNF